MGGWKPKPFAGPAEPTASLGEFEFFLYRGCQACLANFDQALRHHLYVRCTVPRSHFASSLDDQFRSGMIALSEDRIAFNDEVLCLSHAPEAIRYFEHSPDASLIVQNARLAQPIVHDFCRGRASRCDDPQRAIHDRS
jgi:hypothetical protein